MEALANVNQFGVCELREDELMEVDGESRLSYDLGQAFYRFWNPEPKDYREGLEDRLKTGDTGKAL